MALAPPYQRYSAVAARRSRPVSLQLPDGPQTTSTAVEAKVACSSRPEVAAAAAEFAEPPPRALLVLEHNCNAPAPVGPPAVTRQPLGSCLVQIVYAPALLGLPMTSSPTSNGPCPEHIFDSPAQVGRPLAALMRLLAGSCAERICNARSQLGRAAPIRDRRGPRDRRDLGLGHGCANAASSPWRGHQDEPP